MTRGQDDIPVPRLRDGWDAPQAPPAARPARTEPTVARLEQDRRNLTRALAVFLLGAIVMLILGYRSLAGSAVGVSAGWAIRLYLTQRKIDRLLGSRRDG